MEVGRAQPVVVIREMNKEVNSCFSEEGMTSIVKVTAMDSRTEIHSVTDVTQRKFKFEQWVC